MASLAQYSATLHAASDDAERPAPGTGTKLVGAAIYGAVFALVGIAGMLHSAAG